MFCVCIFESVKLRIILETIFFKPQHLVDFTLKRNSPENPGLFANILMSTI